MNKPSHDFHVCSEERLAQLNMELETSRANALDNSSVEASNLSFEMSEADM